MTGEVGTCLQMVPTASLMCGLREGMQFSAGGSCEVDSQNFLDEGLGSWNNFDNNWYARSQ